MSKLNSLIQIIITSFIVIILSESGLSDSSPSLPSPPIKIGMLLTLSGSYASAGADSRQGVEAALAVAGGSQRLEFIFADSKGDPTTAVSEFRKLTSIDRVLGIYTHRSNIGMAINPISQKLRFPLLGAVGNKNFVKNNEYAVQVWPKTDDEGEFVAEEFVRRGYTKVALLSSQDEWTTSIGDSFRQKFTSLGGTLVYDESFVPTELDFRTQLVQLKTKSPQTIFINALLPQIGPIVRQAKDLGIQSMLYSNFYTAKKDVIDSAGPGIDGMRFVDVDADLPILKGKLREGSIASGLTLASYLATLLLDQVVTEDPMINTSEALYTGIIRQHEIRTPDGNFLIQDRCVKIPLVIKAINSGKVTNEVPSMD